MIQELFDFLKNLFPQDRVALAYSDDVTEPGLTLVFYETNVQTDKELDGTTNMLIGTYTVEVWHNSMKEVLESSNVMFHAMEGTKFQIQSMTSVRVDGNKRKWHREISVQIMEDV